eukprot:gene40705-40501_t
MFLEIAQARADALKASGLPTEAEAADTFHPAARINAAKKAEASAAVPDAGRAAAADR